MNQNLRIRLTRHGDLWMATCEGIDCGGCGPTEEEAIKNFAISLMSTFTSEILETLRSRSGVERSQSYDLPAPTLGAVEYAA